MNAEIETRTAPRRLYPESVIIVILGRVSAGESIAAICEDAGMPSKASWHRWISEDHELSAKYCAAVKSAIDKRYSR